MTNDRITPAVCLAGVIIMQFITGCRDNNSEAPREDLMSWSKDGEAFPPVTLSQPCPFKNVTYFVMKEGVIAAEDTAKYYLVDFESGSTAKPRIYLLDSRESMDEVHRWLAQNAEELEKKSGVANLPQMFPWHNELLQYGKNGRIVCYITDYAEPEEYRRLVTVFRNNGSRIETVPGRKPPLVQGPDGQFPIEWIVDEEKSTARQRP